MLVSPATTHAEIEKFAVNTDTGISLYWWPQLSPVRGWHQDWEHSYHYSFNALAPDGQTFATAETVMYARAVFKPRAPDAPSLEVLIEKDKSVFGTNARIQEAPPLKTADGKAVRSVSFFPNGQGNWERISYFEEGEFYVIFAISSRSLTGYKRNMIFYEKMVGRYKERP